MTNTTKPTILWKYIIKASVLCFGLALLLNTYTGNAFACIDKEDIDDDGAYTGNAFACIDKDNVKMDILDCTGTDIKTCNRSHKNIKAGVNGGDMYYSLAVTCICLGRKEEGVSHLQKAADMGFAEAFRLIAIYHNTDETFDSSINTRNRENLKAAIYHYKKAVEIIENTYNPSDEDMKFYESGKIPASYNTFIRLPMLYFNVYVIAIEDMLYSGKQEVSYSDTLTVLKSMETEALRCLQSPDLSGRKNKDVIYETQQIVCGASLDFARNAHPLERERIKAAENCKIQLSECSEHQEIMNALFQLVQGMFTQIN